MKLKELIEKYEEYENGLFDFGAKIACQIFFKRLATTRRTRKKSKFRSLWRILLQNRKNWGIHCPTQ